MNVVNGKRITFKRTRPNPLFNDWLQELYDEAKQKRSKLECMLKEALSSISKYPLPLQSGAECAILKGFDKRLCLFLDKRLEIYKSSSSESVGEACSKSSAPSVSDDENDLEPLLEAQSTLKTYRNPSIASNSSTVINIDNSSFSCNNPPNKHGTFRRYKPASGSGSYALLMGLVDLNKNETMGKEQLIMAAQKYFEGDISTEWKYMTKLIRKGLVHKSIENGKPRFCLTQEGLIVGKELSRHIQKKTSEDGIISTINDVKHNDHVENKSAANDLLYDETECTIQVTAAKGARNKLIANTLLQGELISYSAINDNDNNKCKTDVTNSRHVDTSNYNHIAPSKCTTSIELDNCGVSENDKDIDYSTLIEMEPGSFEIILLIDIHETSGLSKKNDPTVTQFNKYPELKHEYRSLKVGDFTWIARSKRNKDLELVLPYVVERKRMDDLGHSIKDGRFHEQKFRLRKCGLNHVIYMVENHGSNKHVGLPMQSLMQALANTRVQDGFKVHITESLGNSVSFLATMTLRLMYEYKDKRLKGSNGESKGDTLMTFKYFNKSSVKNRALSVTDTFIKLLLQLKGVSVEKALTITNVYKTPRSLVERYKSCDQKEGEMLLANLRFGELNRSVGPSVSKSVYQLFTFRKMK